MNDLTVTVAGWAATDPKLHVGAQGTSLVSFRVASTPRYFDRSKQQWVDGQTEWFTVRAFRAAAITIKKSIEKGQPVIVAGRMRTNEWDADDGTRVDLVIDATSVGHDVTRGIASFTRAVGDEKLDQDAGADAAGDSAGEDADESGSQNNDGDGDGDGDAGAATVEREPEEALSA